MKLERDIWEATRKMGVFACFEVTIGWYGHERVDYLTYDTNGTFRCYEIKVSKYVMPYELYEQVNDNIPAHIGVYCGKQCVKRAKRQELAVDEKVLKDSLIRSLYREAEKIIKSENSIIINRLKRLLKKAESEAKESSRRHRELMRIGQEKYGRGWHREKEELEEIEQDESQFQGQDDWA